MGFRRNLIRGCLHSRALHHISPKRCIHLESGIPVDQGIPWARTAQSFRQNGRVRVLGLIVMASKMKF
eukprot:1157347-Pelagomonas_calceolata.AAC.4